MTVNLYTWLKIRGVNPVRFLKIALESNVGPLYEYYKALGNGMDVRALCGADGIPLSGNIPNTINFAFTWDETEEGFYYWENIDSLWYTTISSIMTDNPGKSLSDISIIFNNCFKIKG